MFVSVCLCVGQREIRREKGKDSGCVVCGVYVGSHVIVIAGIWEVGYSYVSVAVTGSGVD